MWRSYDASFVRAELRGGESGPGSGHRHTVALDAFGVSVARIEYA